MYGLSIEDYNKMLLLQKNKCAICQSEFIKTPHVDHCHDTGKVRGLLCKVCNVSLGGFNKPQILKSAIEYLEEN